MIYDEIFSEKFSIIGNFPYNISSQIFFKVLENRNQVEQVVCMLQKEVADRIAAPPGTRPMASSVYCFRHTTILSILFKVPPGVFTPPPKVMSAVIRLRTK